MGYIGAGITRFNTADELTVTGDAQIDTTTLVVDSTNNRVGIGTSGPSTTLQVGDGSADTRSTFNPSSAFAIGVKNGANHGGFIGSNGSSGMQFSSSGGGHLMTIDSSGNVLVGTTTNLTGAQLSAGTTGIALRGDSDQIVVARDGGVSGIFNRNTSDGGIITFQKDGSDVGSIGNRSTALQVQSNGGVGVDLALNNIFPLKSGSLTDDAVTLGDGTRRFKDLYLSGGAYIGGTAAANQLDDYEEGTFTPSITLGGSATGMTFHHRNGFYTKVGRLVTIFLSIRINAVGSSTGSVRITGMPFQAADLGSGYQHPVGNMIFWNQATTTVFAPMAASSSELQTRSLQSTGDAQAGDADFQNGTAITLTISYHV